ncbi:MAG TPA: RNA polymerase sigma-70 factor [Bacteroidales bacterium]|nr:RNA polymerase sigma-70 factor [Bacteroidales bacterium]
MVSDQELIEQLKTGDDTAFEIIFTRYFEKLCLFAESIVKNHDLAEDIVEDIFLQLWINCKTHPIQISLKSYLYQCVYNNSVKSVSRQRKNVCSFQSDSIDDDAFMSADYPVANLILQELEQKASEIVEALPEQCRRIYLLNRDEGLKYHEIASRLGISVGTVKTQMSRAFAKLREDLKEFLYIFF